MVIAGVAPITALPVFVSVKGNAEELVETVCLPKLLELGVKLIDGKVPVPIRDAVGLLAPVIDRVPVLVPVSVGENVTLTVQVALTTRVLQLLV